MTDRDFEHDYYHLHKAVKGVVDCQQCGGVGFTLKAEFDLTFDDLSIYKNACRCFKELIRVHENTFVSVATAQKYNNQPTQAKGDTEKEAE